MLFNNSYWFFFFSNESSGSTWNKIFFWKKFVSTIHDFCFLCSLWSEIDFSWRIFWFRLTFVDCFSGLFSLGFYNETTNISELIRKNNNLVFFLTNFYTHIWGESHIHTLLIYTLVLLLNWVFIFFYFNLQKLYFVSFLNCLIPLQIRCFLNCC